MLLEDLVRKLGCLVIRRLMAVPNQSWDVQMRRSLGLCDAEE